MKTSGKDINDKLMKLAGFKRYPQLDDPKFNACGKITYWINAQGVWIITQKKEKLSLAELVVLIANNAVYQTRQRIKDKAAQIDYGAKGFIRE